VERGVSVKQLRVVGHTLVGEGAMHYADDCDRCRYDRPNHRERSGGDRIYGNGGGHGRCSCGQMSAHLPSAAARQRWHYGHKLLVTEAE
jgi:hypothetical protein